MNKLKSLASIIALSAILFNVVPNLTIQQVDNSGTVIINLLDDNYPIKKG